VTASTLPATTRPTEADWAAAVELLRSAREVVLACHVGPDGDALGSMLALGIALRRSGTRVCCSWGDDELVVPLSYRYLPGLDLLVPAAAVPDQPDVVVTLDTASADRLGALAARAAAARALLVVDHHASNSGFGTHLLLDTAAPATAALVAELVDRLGVPLDAEIAAGIYTGLTTDTGSFKYAATTAATHRLAARLLETGIRADLIGRAIWDTHPSGYLHVLGAALGRLRVEPAEVGGLGLVSTHTTAADLAEYGVTLADIEGVIDVIRTAQEAEIAVVCKGDADGTWKVSLRSKGAVDVGALCLGLGGGGHRYAAGFTAHEPPDVTVARLRELLTAAVGST
jgi:phosphoesterase RecJ-like protein